MNPAATTYDSTPASDTAPVEGTANGKHQSAGRLLRFLPLGLLFTTALTGGWYVRHSYADAQYVVDDFDFITQVGLVATGKWPMVAYLAAPQGPHPMVAWRLMWYLEWAMYGMRPVLFRLTITALHALSAVAVFLLLKHYLRNRLAAIFGALIWGLAAIGGWENPLFWLACGMIPLGIFWMLWAMVCITRAGSAGGMTMPLLFAFCTGMSLMAWGNMVALLPVLPVQYLWLEHGLRARWRVMLVWLTAWAVPFALLGALQIVLVLPHVGKAVGRHEFSILNILERVGGQLSVSWGSLTYAHVVSMTDESLLLKSIVAGLTGVLLLTVLRGRRLKLLLLIFAVVMVNLILVNIGGASIEFSSAMASGRYFYIPTLFWCMAAAALGDEIAFRWANGRIKQRILVAATAIALGLFIAHQRGVAATARRHFDHVATPALNQFARQREFIEQVAAEGRRRGQPVRCVDLPTALSNTSRLLWMTSNLVTVCLPEELQFLQLIPLDKAEPGELQSTVQMARNLNALAADEWAGFLAATGREFELLLWLSHYAELNQQTIRLPNFWFSHGSVTYPANQCAVWGFSRPLPYLVFPPAGLVSRDEVRRLIEKLSQTPSAEARDWIGILNRLLRDDALFPDAR